MEVSLVLSLNTRFILIDEPFTGIEPIYKDIIINKLEQSKNNAGILLTDHDYRNVIKVSNRIYLILDGVCREIQNLDQLYQIGYLPKSTR